MYMHIHMHILMYLYIYVYFQYIMYILYKNLTLAILSFIFLTTILRTVTCHITRVSLFRTARSYEEHVTIKNVFKIFILVTLIRLHSNGCRALGV